MVGVVTSREHLEGGAQMTKAWKRWCDRRFMKKAVEDVPGRSGILLGGRPVLRPGGMRACVSRAHRPALLSVGVAQSRCQGPEWSEMMAEADAEEEP